MSNNFLRLLQAELEELELLDLRDNPITEIEGYRQKVLELLPRLDVIYLCF